MSLLKKAQDGVNIKGKTMSIESPETDKLASVTPKCFTVLSVRISRLSWALIVYLT